MEVQKKYYRKLINTPFPEEYSREGVLQYIADTEVVEQFTKGYLKKNLKDYLTEEYMQEIWVQICQLPEEKLKDLYWQGPVSLRAFIIQMIKQNCISIKSRAYYHVIVPTKNTYHFTDWDNVQEGETPFLEVIRNNDLNDLNYEHSK